MVSRQKVIEALGDYCRGDIDSIFDLNDICNEYMENDSEYLRENAEALAIQGMNIFAMSGISYNVYFLLSFLLKATDNLTVFKTLLQYCMVDDELTKEQKFFVYYQLIQYGFAHPNVTDDELGKLFDQLYSHIYESYCKALCIEKNLVPSEQRNKNVVVVMSSQVLELVHAPTKTLLDRCHVLKNKMDKTVYIINTAEFMSNYQLVNFFWTRIPSYIDSYSKGKSLSYENDEYPFMQCPREMPQESIIKDIMERIKELNPYFIVNIGGNSIVSDLCSNMVPTLTLSTVFSGRACTRGQFQAVGRPVNEEDRQWLAERELPEDHLISSLFTFAFKKQEHHYLRQDIGLPTDGFVVLLVGGRLDSEISEELEVFMEDLMKQGIYFAFAGIYNRFDELKKERPIYDKMGINLGFQQDILAIDECCNLCLNPERTGGGSSVAEALYKGIPVVTFNYGDGGLAAGENFWVTDYEDMGNTILRYRSDASFYKEQSELAKERGRQLTNSEGEFIKIIQKMEASPRF